MIGIIERYQLQRFDEKNYAWDRVRRTDEPEVVKEEVPNEPTSKSTAGLKIYEVKSGDTLYSIAVRFGMSVLDLKSINSLHQETVYIGQLLIVSK